MGNVFFARVGLRNYTGKSRCILTLRRDTSGLTHATRILSCDKALVSLLTTCSLTMLASCISAPQWQVRLTSDDPAERIRAIRHFTQAGDTKCLPNLVTCLEDEDTAVRFYAIIGLERLTGRRHGYTYYGSRRDRAIAIRTWRQYLVDIGDGAAANPTDKTTSAPKESAPRDHAANRLLIEGEKESG